MILTHTNINGLYIIEPTIFEDDRGYFFESYNNDDFKKMGLTNNFVQDNQSMSHKNVIRGLHFQSPNHQQIKLVRVINGSIMDVAVDIRKSSPTYGKYYSVVLSNKNKKMFYIPEGFAHGFKTLENNTIVQYKCSDVYNKECEGCLLWNDETVNINWGIDYEPIISSKDKLGLTLLELNSPF